jgi:Sap, sulfolipid-1-addressing protein
MVPVQAIPLALVSSLYPLGLAAVLLLSKATRPRAKEAVFLAGAAVISLAVGFVVVLVGQGTGSGQSGSSSGSYGLELAIGVFFLAAAAVLARRPPRQHNGPSRITRAATEGGLVTVFVAGVVLYLPSPFYLAALHVIGTAGLSTAAAVVWVIVVAAINLLTVEVPVLLFLLAPEQTAPRLGAATDWLGRNEHTVLMVLLAVLGLWEVINGLAGLL